MSEQITIHDGGEAPLAGKSIAGEAMSNENQSNLMQQNGGQAPDPSAGAQQPPLPGGDTGGVPPLGGVVAAG